MRKYLRPALFLLVLLLMAFGVAALAAADGGGTEGAVPGTMEPVGHTHETAGAATQVIEGMLSGFMAFLYITLAAMLPLLWVLSLLLQAGRPLVIRHLRKFHLRFGGDVWWLLYVMMRDMVQILTFVISVFLFFPDLILRLALPVTGPAATVLLLAALAIKLLGRADDNARHFRWVTGLVTAGAVVYLIPFLLGIEAPMHGWETWRNLTSTAMNPGVALVVLYTSMVILFGICGYLFAAVLRRVTGVVATAGTRPVARAVEQGGE